MFAPDFISKKEGAEFGSIFSKDGKEFYYADDTDGIAKIKYTKFENEGWTKPEIIISHDSFSYNDPCLTPDETALFYISDMPKSESDTIKDYDIWYSRKTETGWSAPVNAGDQINTDKQEYYISFTSSGKMYYASNKKAEPHRGHDFDIYTSNFSNEMFDTPVSLNDSINTRRYEADVFVAHDESFLIFTSARRDGFGKGDLYVSFKRDDGLWSEAKNMGHTINTEKSELCPFVTIDGRFLFYTSNQDIYWVEAKILDNYR